MATLFDMIIYLPTLFVLVIAIAGGLARFTNWFGLPKRDETAALGGHAAGLLIALMAACLLRAIVVFSMADSAQWYSPLTSLVPLFFAESIIISIALALQFRKLDGEYSAEEEWKQSLKDGARFAAKYVVVTTLISLPLWWMLAPGNYGVFKGSLAGPLVPDAVDSTFLASQPTTDLAQLRNIQNSAAIPHAFAFAAILAPLGLVSGRVLRAIRRELNGDFRHVIVESRQAPDSPFLRIFNPRGGGRN